MSPTHNDGRDEVNGASESETTPLLASVPAAIAIEPKVAEAAGDASHDDKPLPVVQIMLLCFARMLEPIAFFGIFPFINQMLQKNGQLAEEDVGFYSGLIESLFSLTQMTVMVAWGRASDRFGRKPVLTFSLAGVAVATGLFGFSTEIWQMIVTRCLAGVFAGTVVTIRTMISEHSTAKTQARSFSWFAFSGNLGLFIGPLIGGAFADPATQYGGVFKDIKFVNDFPYALPTIVCGCFGAVAALVSAFFIDETLDKDSTTAISSDEPPMSTWELLKAPGVGMVIYLYGHVMLLAFAYTAIVPVFWFTNVRLGGFGFSELQISLFMALAGFSQAIWLLLVFPPLQHRFGTGGVMRGCARAYPFFMGCIPFIQLLLRRDTDASRIVFWAIGPAALSIGAGVSMSFTAVQLALNDVSPSPQVLGTLNAVALAVISGIRSFAPVVATSIFAFGVKYQLVWGYFAWVMLVIIAFGFTVATEWLPKNAEGKLPREDESES